MGQLVLVAWPDDKLAGAVAHTWESQARQWRWLIPSTLASVNATISKSRLSIEGQSVDAVLWRATPDTDLAVDFTANDQVFADTEARSFWLAAMNLPSLSTPFRPDAAQFFSRSGWSYWRQVLKCYAVKLAPLHYGGTSGNSDRAWFPYSSSRLHSAPQDTTARRLGAAIAPVPHASGVLFAGHHYWTLSKLDACAAPNITAAIRALNLEGLRLGELLVTQEGALIGVDAVPCIAEVDAVRHLINPVLESLNVASNRW